MVECATFSVQVAVKFMQQPNVNAIGGMGWPVQSMMQGTGSCVERDELRFEQTLYWFLNI